VEHFALLAIMFGLVSAVSFGVSDFFGAKASMRFGGSTIGFLVVGIAATLFAVIYALFLRSYTHFDTPAICYAVASGACFTLANTLFYKGLELGPVSIVSPLGSLYPLVTVLVLVMVFGNHLSTQQIVGIGIVVGGALVAAGIVEGTKLRRRIERGPLFGLLAAVFWGLAFALIARAVQRIGWQFPTLIELSTSTLLFVPMLLFLSRSEPGLLKQISSAIRSRWVLIAGSLVGIAFWSVTIGIAHTGNEAAIVVAVSACYPVLTAFLALRHLKEAFQPMPLAGALAAIVGIVVLSLG